MLSAGHGPIFIYSHPEDRFREISAQALPFEFSLPLTPTLQSICLQSGIWYCWPPTASSEWENDQGEQFGVLRLEESIQRIQGFWPGRDHYEAL
jgi:hypothetical protein